MRNLQKFFIFENTVKITRHASFPIYVLYKTFDISRNMGVRKVSNSKSDLQIHSRSLVMVP